MAAKAGSLTIDLNANTARLNSDFKKATAMVNKYKRDARKSFNKVSSAVFSVKGAVLGLAGAGGFGVLINSSLKSNDALAKTADKLNITTKALGGLHHATSLYTSAGANAMNEALTKATKRLGEFNASGGGAGAIWLKKLNLNTKELAKLAPDQLFAKYSESIRGLNDRGQQMAAMSALMGDESRQLIGLVDAMPSALADAAKEAEALGLTMSRMDAAKIEAANDAVTKVQGAIKGAGNAFAVELSPYLEKAANLFTEAAKEAGGFKVIAADMAETVILSVAKVADVVNGLRVVWQGLKVGVSGYVAASIAGMDLVIGSAMKLANIMPGINLDTPIEGLKMISQGATDQFEKEKTKMHNMMMEKPPSNGIIQAFEDIKIAADATAEKVAESKVVSGQVINEIVAQNGMDEATLILFNEGLKTQAVQRETEKRIELAKKEAKAKRDIMGGMFGQLASLMSSKSKRLFEIGKKGAIAGAMIKGYESILNSYAAGTKIGGPYVGAAFAAVAGLVAGTHIQNIKGQSFGGGGGVSTGGTPGTPTTPIITAQDYPQPSESGSNTGSRELRLVIDSDGPHSDGLRKLAVDLAETIKDMGGVDSLVVSQ